MWTGKLLIAFLLCKFFFLQRSYYLKVFSLKFSYSPSEHLLMQYKCKIETKLGNISLSKNLLQQDEITPKFKLFYNGTKIP